MSAGTYDLIIEQGAKFYRKLTWKDDLGAAIDLTGYTARMQIREQMQSSNDICSLTTENGRIVITPLTGQIELIIPATITKTFGLFTSAVYDLELIPSTGETDVIRLLSGKVTISPEVTKL